MDTQYNRQLVLQDYWNMIRRRKGLVILFVVLAMAATYAVNNLVEPVYEASSTLHLKDQKPSVLDGDVLGSSLFSETELKTQLEIMKSRSVLEEVVRALRLADAYGISGDGDQRERTAVEVLAKHIEVSAVSGTTIARISVRSTAGDLAKDITGAICETYIRRNLESRRMEANAVLSFVTTQLDQTAEKVRKSEEELLSYKTMQRIRDLDEESRLKIDQLIQLERQEQDVRVSREILRTRRNILLEQSKTQIDRQNAAMSTPAIDNLKRQLTEQQSRLYLLTTYPGDPHAEELEQTKAKISALKTDVQSELSRLTGPSNLFPSAFQLKLMEYDTEDIVLTSQEEALAKSIGTYTADIGRLPQQQIDLIRLERNRRINDELYSSLSKAKNEAEIEAASQIGNVEIVDPAVSGEKAVWPQKERNLIVAGMISVLLGIALVLLLEVMDTRLRTGDDLGSVLGAPFLGSVPVFRHPGPKRDRKKVPGPEGRMNPVTCTEPESLVSERFRLIRTSLLSDANAAKTLLVTSAGPGEGKTTVASNLAVVLAALGKKVLLVDAALRRPAVHRIFDVPDSPGLADVLTSQTGFTAACRSLNRMENLHVLPCGGTSGNRSDLLGTQSMRELIAGLRNEYDSIIFDAPPLIGVNDALALSVLLDGVLIVTRSGYVERRAMLRVKELLVTMHVPVLGCVLNGVALRDARFETAGIRAR